MGDSQKTPVVLSIAGSDPYGGAGIQADLKTIHALGGYALTVTTALTAQNSLGVMQVFPTPIDIFRSQLITLLDDIQIDAVKIGMLANAEIVRCVADIIKDYGLKNVVLDTVLVSSSGRVLLSEDALSVLQTELFPRATLITPNLPEVNQLLDKTDSPFIGQVDEMPMIAEGFFKLGADAVLIKGGHSANEHEAIDTLMQPNQAPTAFSAKRVHTTHTHGTGCVLSSAIAVHLAQGQTLEQSIQAAKSFLTRSLHESASLNFCYHQFLDNRREPIF